MVEINLYLLLALLQALLVVSVLLAASVWLWARNRRRLGRMRLQLQQLQARTTAVEYLQSELEAAQGTAAEDESAWAAVRAAYLDFELQRAQAQTAGSADLDALGKRLQALLPAATEPAAPSPAAPAKGDEENIDFPEMLHRQAQLLQALKTHVHGCVSNTADLQRGDEKFDMLELVGRELESCTLMMEEENNFLREQIRTLLADHVAASQNDDPSEP